MLCLFLPHGGHSQMPSPDETLESVQGHACYAYGDKETPGQATLAARVLAVEQAVTSHQVFVKFETRIKNLQLEEDLVTTAVAEELRHITEKLEEKDQKICISITAEIDPVSMEKTINQRINAKEVAQKVHSAGPKGTFDLEVWTNKESGQFQEGEPLIIYVKTSRDVFLKIDYFQADGAVVHLVPNMFRSQAFIKGGRRHEFGVETGPVAFVITRPFGHEAIKVLASPRPFDASITTPPGLASESLSYLRSLHKGMRPGMRGVQIMSTASVALHTISKAVADYKAIKGKAFSHKPE